MSCNSDTGVVQKAFERYEKIMEAKINRSKSPGSCQLNRWSRPPSLSVVQVESSAKEGTGKGRSGGSDLASKAVVLKV